MAVTVQWCEVFVCCTVLLSAAECMVNGIPDVHHINMADDDGKLLLTPLLNVGNVAAARRRSRVTDLPGARYQLNSYSGFFTVDKRYNSNLFFWFFPKPVNASNAPLLLWLQGGPGASSLFGMFVENGPYVVLPDMSLDLKPSSWITYLSLLYIDNPVGSGFSYTEDERGYARDEKKVAEDLFEALQQFFVLFPEYQKNDLYLGGQSYAGKYVPALAYRIHTDTDAHWMNLKGIVIGNGYTDPKHMLNYADFLYQVGLIDELQASKIRSLQRRARHLIDEKRWVDAYMVIDTLLVGAYAHWGTLLYNMTGRTHYYNILLSHHPADMMYYRKYLNNPHVRLAIHAGNRTVSDGVEARFFLIRDMMQSVSKWVAEICNYYKVLFYTGQLDIIVNYPLVQNSLRHLKWKHAESWRRTRRLVWKVAPNDPEVAGYVRKVYNVWEVMVRNAGHIVPYDQPWAALDMMRRFLYEIPFGEGAASQEIQ